jgi:hypothetical protein
MTPRKVAIGERNRPCQHDATMSIEVFAWWTLLCTVAAFNIAAWAFSAAAVTRWRTVLSAEAYAEWRLQLLLSAGYVFGCAFRSFVPVYDVPRLCLLDSWLSSVIIGRSVATVAELCFVAQWALLLRGASQDTGSAVGRAVASVLPPLVAIAETCSWYAVLTTSNLGHVLEESLWGLGAALLVASLIALWPRCARRQRPLLALWCVAGVAYVFFMFLVDVPMYWSRWLADEAMGRPYMSLSQGVLDISSRWVVSHRWEAWRSEVTWMSLYFSVGVWISIALIHAPVTRPRGA